MARGWNWQGILDAEDARDAEVSLPGADGTYPSDFWTRPYAERVEITLRVLRSPNGTLTPMPRWSPTSTPPPHPDTTGKAVTVWPAQDGVAEVKIEKADRNVMLEEGRVSIVPSNHVTITIPKNTTLGIHGAADRFFEIEVDGIVYRFDRAKIVEELSKLPDVEHSTSVKETSVYMNCSGNVVQTGFIAGIVDKIMADEGRKTVWSDVATGKSKQPVEEPMPTTKDENEEMKDMLASQIEDLEEELAHKRACRRELLTPAEVLQEFATDVGKAIAYGSAMEIVHTANAAFVDEAYRQAGDTLPDAMKTPLARKGAQAFPPAFVLFMTEVAPLFGVPVPETGRNFARGAAIMGLQAAGKDGTAEVGKAVWEKAQLLFMAYMAAGQKLHEAGQLPEHIEIPFQQVGAKDPTKARVS